ncbi:acyltransferase family protein [Arthrobacter sedimenti]|uniref:acyltransferase family protein n=1 Tax=Arthrobacter sedimenti TaxID=2694931 RepID=UPI001CDCDA90|nr:acyltransferase family protein [Arthrobacter sedimenti]
MVSTLTSSRSKSPRPKGRKSGSALRPDIQGLRALAVIAVILDHLLGWPSGGFVGVDIFFVLSGFLITGLLLREYERTGRISFSGFYRRRIKRILPAAMLVLVLTVAGAFLVFNDARAKSTLVDSVWALLFGANWHQAIVGTDYFAVGDPESPVQHYWSLAVEEQFYIVWPWLMVALFMVAARLFNSRDRPRLIAGSAMLALSIASFAWSVFETSTSPTTAYFSTFSRAWELGVGAFLACASTLLPRLPAALRPYLAWAGLAGIIASLFTINAETAFPGPSAALPVLSTALVIAAGTGAATHRGLAPLTNRVSGYIGGVSYSLYLWHFPVIIIGTTLFGNGPVQNAVMALVFTTGAIYAYHLVEDPIRRSDWLKDGWHGRRSRGAWIAPATYKMTAFSLLVVVTAGAVWISLIPTKPSVAAVAPVPISGIPADAAATTKPQMEALQANLAKALATPEWPEGLRPALDEALVSPQAPPDVAPCSDGVVDETQCTWGDPQAEHTAMTIGNSISMTYVEALRTALGTDDGWNLMSYGKFGCPIVDSESIPVDECSERLDQTVDAINRVHPDVVFIAGVEDGPSAKIQLDKVTVSTMFVFLPGPPGDNDLSTCYTRLSSPADCAGSVQGNFGSVEKGLAKAFDGSYVDSSGWFCHEGRCPSFVEGTVMKLDARHMTPEYARYIAPVIRENLEQSGIIQFTAK